MLFISHVSSINVLSLSEVIDLYANQLTGRIPSELANLPKLHKLDLHDNNLIGTMVSLPDFQA